MAGPPLAFGRCPGSRQDTSTLQLGPNVLSKTVLRVEGAKAGTARPFDRQGGAGNGSSFRY